MHSGDLPPHVETRDPGASSGEHPVILLIEDGIQEAFLIQLAMEKSHASLRLQHIMDGRTAIDYFKANGRYADRKTYPLPQLVILDLHLPGLHGLEVLAFIRDQEAHRSLPVFIFTDSVNPQDRSRAKALGATGYLEKPLGIAALVEMVTSLQRYLARKGQSR